MFNFLFKSKEPSQHDFYLVNQYLQKNPDSFLPEEKLYTFLDTFPLTGHCILSALNRQSDFTISEYVCRRDTSKLPWSETLAFLLSNVSSSLTLFWRNNVEKSKLPFTYGLKDMRSPENHLIQHWGKRNISINLYAPQDAEFYDSFTLPLMLGQDKIPVHLYSISDEALRHCPKPLSGIMLDQTFLLTGKHDIYSLTFHKNRYKIQHFIQQTEYIHSHPQTQHTGCGSLLVRE